MEELVECKSLVTVKEKGTFYKLKKFFNKIFKRKPKYYENIIEEPAQTTEFVQNTSKSILDEVNKIENSEERLNELQKYYRSGSIKESDLTEVQITSLCNLFDSQIATLKYSNELQKNKIV